VVVTTITRAEKGGAVGIEVVRFTLIEARIDPAEYRKQM